MTKRRTNKPRGTRVKSATPPSTLLPQTNLHPRPAKGTPARDRELHATAVRVDAPTFTLVGWDVTAPATIRDWAVRAARAGSNAEKVGTAILASVTFEDWQAEHGVNVPD